MLTKKFNAFAKRFRLSTQSSVRTSSVVTSITGNDSNQQMTIIGEDEIRILTGTIQDIANQVSDLMNSLEKRTYELETEIAERKKAEEEKEKAKEEIRNHNRKLTLLNRIITASAAGSEPETILKTACRELARTFDLPQTTAVLLNEEKTEAVLVAGYTIDDHSSTLNETLPVAGNPLFQYLLNHKAPLAVDNTQDNPRLIPIHDDSLCWQEAISSLILPLVIEEEVVGSLNVEAIEPRHFSTEEVNLAWSVATEIAGALSRTRLTQTHQLLVSAISQASESVSVTDTEGTILYINPAFEQITGYSRTEALGKTLHILKHNQPTNAFYQQLWTTISAGKVWHGRFADQKKDGTPYTADVTITPVRDESGAIVNYVSVQRDVTHELQMEEQYRQMQKMEAIGRLAGGVAHDFNNVLTAVMGYAGLTLAKLSPDDPNHSDIEGIHKAAERATNLTRQLLTFARKQIIHPTVLNLNDLIIEVDKMLRRLIGEDIELITLPAPNLGQVKMDSGQAEQILLNLAINARDAMPNGGKLTIETANVTLDKDYITRHAEMEAGEYVLLAISDNGTGMSEEVKDHIFEPFFSTKDIDKGTGLGLTTCFGIVKQSGGHIWVYSEVNRGTTFKVYLPRFEETANLGWDRGRSDALPLGTETVLLVEDEATVRDLASRALYGQGYNVLGAANGDEALRVAQMHAETGIHLLVTDVVMPRLGGEELASRLKTMCPDLKVLFISGYTGNAMIQHGTLKPDMAFLPKPFSLEKLVRKVRQVLDGEDTP